MALDPMMHRAPADVRQRRGSRRPPRARRRAARPPGAPRPAPAARRRDRLGQHPVPDGPLAADAEPDDRAPERRTTADARREAAHERAERVEEHRRTRASCACRRGRRARRATMPPRPDVPSATPSSHASSVGGEVQVAATGVLTKPEEDEVVEVERPAEEAKR